MKIRFTSHEKGQRVIIDEFNGQVLFQADEVITVYLPQRIADKLRNEVGR